MTQTAGLAVSYFDRFVSKTERHGLDKHRVQLLAITCTLIAAKFSEIKMPSLDDLCEVAHDKYSKAQLKEMEENIRTNLTGQERLQVLPVAMNNLAYFDYHTLTLILTLPQTLTRCSPSR